MATVITLTPEQLSALIQNAVSQAMSGSSAPSKPLKAKKVSGDVKTKRAPSPWAAWCKFAPEKYSDEYAAWRAENPDVKGPAIGFCSYKKSTSAGAYAEFETHYKASAADHASVASADTTDIESIVTTESKKARGRPKLTDDEKKLRAAERKAKKAAAGTVTVVPAPAAIPVSSDELTVDAWTHPVSGIVYQRSNENHLWLDDNGELGEWAGTLDPVTLKIDDSTDAPNL
jgi:hypothetical protein